MKFLLILFGLFSFWSGAAARPGSLPSDSTLSAEEKTGLSFMREEEKLAYDVYRLFFTKWELMPFDHISGSESRHMAAVKSLLDRYELPDPAADKDAGRFADATLQQLYNKLTAQGKQTKEDALKAGALIEEVDIRDLQNWLQKTNNPAIIQVYEKLMRGSRNHLRAFVRNLSQYGITYEPVYLSKEDFKAIIDGPMEPGGGMNRNR